MTSILVMCKELSAAPGVVFLQPGIRGSTRIAITLRQGGVPFQSHPSRRTTLVLRAGCYVQSRDDPAIFPDLDQLVVAQHALQIEGRRWRAAGVSLALLHFPPNIRVRTHGLFRMHGI